jgi:DNA (cytosine-5)-methyltransferase 1
MTAVLPGFQRRATARRMGRRRAELVVDNFAGASLGIEAALGRAVDIAVNHSRLMLLQHGANHPHTRHLCEDVWDVQPLDETQGRPVGLAWFSPDCKHHSKAKGGVPLDKGIRGLAWVVLRWALEVRPRVIILENVEEFADWGPLAQKTDEAGRPVWIPDVDAPEGRRPFLVADRTRRGEYFRAFVGALGNGMFPGVELVEELQEFFGGQAPLYRLMKGCGYNVEFRELVAADYGVPTTRKRFFLVARCDGRPIRWPARTHAPRAKAAELGLLPWRAAAECIDWSLPCPSIFERRRPLAEATLRRIARGLVKYVLNAAEPFIVRCAHGEGCAAGPRWGNGEHGTADPLPTVTASKDFAVVAPVLASCGGSGNHHAVVAASLVTNTTGHAGTHPADPAPTLTSGGQQALAAAHLTKFYGKGTGQPATEPMPTITGGGAGGNSHVGEVRAFLVKYYSSGGQGQDIRQPLHTLTDKARMGLVTVAGEEYQVADIGLRMLEPRELLRAQFGRFAAEYVLLGTKAQQVAAIGNSVPPELAEALVRANFRGGRR